MSIRGRVGRHTQVGGRNCQNWPDDQKTVIDLLNRIPVSNGGTGGSLHPRIINGMASDELYNAIVTFENKYWPGQRSGFVDPGGKMYQKLEALAAAAAAPATTPPKPAAPPPPPPAPLPDIRYITTGERHLLVPVFEETLPYEQLKVTANFGNWGGEDNSITPNGIPHYATKIWCADFSDATTATKGDRATFIHEFVHVWQYYHGYEVTKPLEAIGLFARYRGDYQPKAYYYDLSDEDDFTDFNIEQQASIIEDWWRILNGLSPQFNIGNDKTVTTYNHFVDQMRGAGPPNKDPVAGLVRKMLPLPFPPK